MRISDCSSDVCSSDLRRHKSGSVNVGGTGSQAADAAVIPSIALKSIEVLRDGAAAQYGSDAIAGVINFQLKDAPDGGSLTIQTGQYYRSEEHTSELQSLMRISYAVFCLKKKSNHQT